MSRMVRWSVIGLMVLAGAGCATGRSVRKAEAAVDRNDLDTAVAYYRQALASAPSRVDLQIALARYTRLAAEAHVKRARDLEAQSQWSGALAEYRLAADLDPTTSVAAAKAAEIEQRIRTEAEAARPQARIDQLKQQAAQTSPVPHLDPRTSVRNMHFPNAAVRDVLSSIGTLTGLNITYDQGLDATLSRFYSLDVTDTPLEDVLNQVLSANTLTYKVVNDHSIFVYQDNPTNRQKYEDQYTQTFYISNADPQELVQLLNQLLQTGPAVRPIIVQNKSMNSIIVRATAPVLKIVSEVIAANDKPKPDVVIEAEILEVDRSFMRQLGLDLNQYALGLAFSPEVAPSTTATAPGAFPNAVPPISLNTLSHPLSSSDLYVTSPTALIRLLESNATTRVLAKPELRGRDGVAMQINLGDQIPLPQTVFNATAAGGAATIPATQVQYEAVGVNLLFTPRVTYQDEIVLDTLTLEKSGLGNNLEVGGQTFPTIQDRKATGSVRLRDGETTLIGGLLSNSDQTTIKSLPGLTKLPILRSLFGNSNIDNESTDVVMLLTPHIVRSHELTATDLQPMYVGTNQNFGAGGAPPLISPDALAAGGAPPASAFGAPAAGTASSVAPAAASGGSVTTPNAPQTASAPPSSVAAPIQAVPIVPVGPAGAAPATPPATARITLTAPTPQADGSLAAGSGPNTIPITIAGANAITSLSLSISYDPAVISNPTVTQGSFMSQGGVTATFTPHVDAPTGRIDLAFSRPTAQPGASNAGLVGSISFTAGAAGATDIVVSGVAMTASGQSIPLTFSPIRIVVK